eukprot:1530963-Rhodomonas_salina.1
MVGTMRPRVKTLETMWPCVKTLGADSGVWLWQGACLARRPLKDDTGEQTPNGEISGTLDFFINKFEEVDNAVRLGDPEYNIVYGADHRSREHNDF